MSQTLSIITKAISQMALALFLGYCFSTTLMKGLLPDSWAGPDAIVFGIVLFLAWRWAKWAGIVAETSRHPELPQPHTLIAQLTAPDQQHVFRNPKVKAARRKKAKREARCA